MKLSEICRSLKEYTSFDFEEKEIYGIAYNSHKIKEGYLFVAIKGHKLDGHDFVTAAINNGAVAIVVNKRVETASRIPQIVVANTRQALACISSCFYGEPSSKMIITGVTGTNGKTTTTYFTKSIIEASGNKAGLIGTIQYQIGSRVIPAQETTPESIDIQGYLSEMLKAGIKYAVTEASSHALSQHRLDNVNFRSAIFTNLSAEHLDYHVDIKGYRAEKIKLVENLSKDSFAILNADDNASKRFAERTKSKIIWYGMKRKRANVTAEIISMGTDKTSFLLNSPWGKETIHLKLVGKHNVYNALAAAANGLALGFDINTIKNGIENLSGVPGRLERLNYGQEFDIYVDFAHTHHALQVMLSAVRESTSGRIILVFGCGGDRDKNKRPKMGHVAEKYSDVFWITSDNPRSEDPDDIIREIRKGVSRDACFHVQSDRKIAITEAILEARKDDVVIIAGKGHEQCQILKDKTIPFDDRAVVREVLQNNLMAVGLGQWNH